MLTPSVGRAYVAFSGNLPSGRRATQLFSSNPILVQGELSSNVPPSFSDESSSRGVWGNQSFVNLVRNAGTQAGWIRFRPLSDYWFSKALHHSPAQILDALLDTEYTWPYLAGTIVPALYTGFFNNFAWGHIRLQAPVWNLLALLLTALALLGCVKWSTGSKTAAKSALAAPLFVVALAGILVWLIAIAWPLPYRWAKVTLPSARYTFPALLPTVLVIVGGWWALWPRRFRVPALVVLILAFLALDSAAVVTIWSFYHSLPISS